ncbi:DMT family transporter [Neobacillus sp. SAB-20_R2A]|uniref:DMT family transporter n=1 Tax=Neobacillus sp. SAB-20_R2A TaxID=3120519 RepID=UPI003C6DF74C
MSWVLLCLSGFTEIAAVVFIKFSQGFSRLKPTIAVLFADAFTFYLLSLALISLPVSTAYSVWTGITTAGTVIIGMLFFNEKRSFKKMISLILIIISVIGLKLIS